MSNALLGRCPGCKKTLRLPEAAIGKPVRCRHCGMVSEARPTATLAAKRAEPRPAQQAASKPTPVAPPAIPMAQPVTAPAPGAVVVPAPANWAPVATGNPFADITEASFNDPGVSPTKRYRKRGGGWIAAVLALGFLFACLSGTAALILIVVPKMKERMAQQEQAKNAEPNTPSAAAHHGNQDQAVEAGAGTEFPRRLLGISVNNYIFANPTSYGHDPTNYILRSFGQTLEKIANRLRIPPSQVFELSDGAPDNKKQPPLRPIIEKTLEQFCTTSRPQDRVIIVLCGHTVEIEKKPYFVPLEGEIDDAATLIPLEWIMQQIAKCPAQQKLLIADFNRYDKGRGQERPSGGKLSESAAEMLKNPPPGVQVWSACSAGQYSYEFDDFYDFGGQGIKGGAFLNMFSVAFIKGGGLKGIQKPSDPLPIDGLAELVNANTIALSLELPNPLDESDDAAEEKKDEMEKKPAAPAKREPLQTPFIAGAMSGTPVAFNPTEPPPQPVKIPTPQEVYGKNMLARDEVRKLLDIFKLPPIKEARTTETTVQIDEVLPFTAEAMAEYRNTGPLETIKKNPDKYPLRIAVLDAIEKLRALDASDIALPTQLSEADRSDAAKGNLARLQRGPARVMQQLEELRESLAQAGEERKEEKSKFWQATFDYVMAQVNARYVYVHEYTSVIGQVRRDQLPELNKAKGHVGWRLASSERLVSGNEVRDMAKDARKIYRKLAKDHPGTPWAVLAKRDETMALGLRWEIYSEPKAKQDDSVAAK